jgi:hypothetical protein
MRQSRPVAKKTTRPSLDDEIAHLRDSVMAAPRFGQSAVIASSQSPVA